MLMTTLFGSLAFITSVIGLLPQVVKTWQSRSAADVSMLMLINYSICSLAWIVYGGYSNSWFVLSSNVLGLISSLILIGLKWHYDAKASAV